MRDPEASDAFTLSQLEDVKRVADSKEILLQTGSGYVNDPKFLGELVRVLAYTGMHISVLSGGVRHRTLVGDRDIPDSRWTEATYNPPLGPDSIHGHFLYWRRPKNDKPIAMPIKPEMAPWLGAFLAKPRPRSTRRYEQILESVEDEVGFACNPLRFRHTCGVILYHVLKMDAAAVQKLLGCTAKTMLTYVLRTKEQIREDMIKAGW